jgi:hypothetical protein
MTQREYDAYRVHLPLKSLRDCRATALGVSSQRPSAAMRSIRSCGWDHDIRCQNDPRELESDDTSISLPTPQAKPKKKITVAPADDSHAFNYVLREKTNPLKGGARCPQRALVLSLSRQRLGDKPLHLQLQGCGLVCCDVAPPARRASASASLIFTRLPFLSWRRLAGGFHRQIDQQPTRSRGRAVVDQ